MFILKKFYRVIINQSEKSSIDNNDDYQLFNLEICAKKELKETNLRRRVNIDKDNYDKVDFI